MAEQPKKTIQEKFLAFHQNNPEVFQLILKEARRALQAKKQKFGVKAIIEYIRWNKFIETHDAPMFDAKGEKRQLKLNNVYASRYARMLIEKYPEFEGKIETRELLSQ